ncbi:fatty acid synthase [Periconia macrospinosa]|uniref:Fatty acid synthase n=1 Tax=Periconia macrospinosa TaxID=97972 RepID=A0A2V1DQ65_9PLEO|nr:fatty acid synthase [Periconia macrospinosa]
MTPTTTHPDFVAAIMRAGYHVEFAAGGYHNADKLRSALFQLRDLMPLGRTITMNIIYASPKTISWQIPFIRQLRAEGFPLAGLCIGGGVPSLEVATDYITSLNLEHISFKPSSVESIKKVVEIAKKNAPFPVILQWTGGRGGGHHSKEDFHTPILETYALIRECSNICLVAGSGFGSSENIAPYFTGSWSLRHGKRSTMPFDGILLGSRVMISAEAHTSHGAKAAIVKAEGVSDKDWSGTYRKPTGGIISVVSEMGEPIHVIATRGARLWAELDKTIFSVEKKKRIPLLVSKKHYLMARLNKDFQRPWFGKKADGTPCEILEMTYLEVAKRLIELMFARKWIDPSYQTLTERFLERMEARLADGNIGARRLYMEDGRVVPEHIEVAFPCSSMTLICPEDRDYFLQLCRSPGMKPVPFIPALDEHFETWFKKDSLWQSEACESVIDQDADRTFILHGPVAAQYTSTVDEPVGEILDHINKGVMKDLEKLGGFIPSTAEGGVQNTLTLGFATEESGWAKTLNASEFFWVAALLESPYIKQHGHLTENYVRSLVRKLTVTGIQTQHNTLSLITGDAQPILRLSFDGDSEIQVTILTNVNSSQTPIPFVYRYKYDGGSNLVPIEQMMEDHNERLSNFYRQLWCPDSSKTESGLESAVVEHDFCIQGPSLERFRNSIGYQGVGVPIDYAIVISWKTISQLLVHHPIDLLNLVHLSNQFQMFRQLAIGDTVRSTAEVNAVVVRDTGLELEVKCTISANNKALVDIRSRFLVRGDSGQGLNPFKRQKPGPYEIKLSSATDVAILLSKDWFVLDDENRLVNFDLVNVTLQFEPEVFTRQNDEATTGNVYIVSEAEEPFLIGRIDQQCQRKRGNSVLPYLRRHGKDISCVTQQQDSIVHTYMFNVPKNNEKYSYASGDFNPIHTSETFAHMAGLPGTITHGMYCSAIVRQVFEREICKCNAVRFESFHVDFTSMVLPNDTLHLTIRKVGMRFGTEQFQFEVECERTGEKVLKGSASIAPAPTTFCFTGQGSAAKGMGMDLYASSVPARSVWDRAEAYFVSQYGLSILDIVRNNPKELTVHFGGVRGRQLRRNYQMMQFEMPPKVPGGEPEFVPMFPSIDAHSTSFTHRSPTGLLLATQFTQPALALMEMAAFADMKAAGVVTPGHHFAGHSLGEYISLACSANFMALESMLYLFFCRGMTMQSAVERDADERSDYSMVAVDPSRVSKAFTDNESALTILVKTLREKTGFFIEVVNLNVRGKQYVCAGDLRALDLLQQICDDIKTNHDLYTDLDDETHLAEIVERYAANNRSHGALPASQVKLSRGLATIPLAGIDVPFHSSYLYPRMEGFRNLLESCLDSKSLDPNKLVGRYIPNVTGTPFQIHREYFEQVLHITGSERIRYVLRDWSSWENNIKKEREATAMVGAVGA